MRPLEPKVPKRYITIQEWEAEERARQDAEAVIYMREHQAHRLRVKQDAASRAQAEQERVVRKAAERQEARARARLVKATIAAADREFKMQAERERKANLAQFLRDRGTEREQKWYAGPNPDGLDMARERERVRSEREALRSEWASLLRKRPDSEQ